MRYLVLFVLALGCRAADAVTAPPGSPAAPVADAYALNGTWTLAGSTPGLSGVTMLLVENARGGVHGRWKATRVACTCPDSGAVLEAGSVRRGRHVLLQLAFDGFDPPWPYSGNVKEGPSALVEGDMSDPTHVAVTFMIEQHPWYERTHGEGILSR